MKNNINTLKILIIVKSIDGGTGTFILDFLKIKKLYKDGEIVIKTLVLERPTYRKIKEKGFKYLRREGFYPQHYSLAFRNFLAFYKEILWIRKWITKSNPQIIVGIDMRCNLLAIVSKLLSRRPFKVVATSHIDLGRMLFDKSTPILNFILRFIIHFFYNQADILVGVSKELSSNLKKDFHLKQSITTIYNGLNITRAKPHIVSKKDRKVIISVGRLSRQKDFETLIKAFSMLLKQMTKIELWILGDGPKRQELKKLVKKYSLEKQIIFFGWINNVKSYISQADIFVLSSKMEGFGYVLIEAMQGGIPVISTNTPYGPKEILGNGKYGILVPIGQPVKMQKAMFEVLSNKNKYNYFSKKSMERSKYFSIDEMIKGYKYVISKLVD